MSSTDCRPGDGAPVVVSPSATGTLTPIVAGPAHDPGGGA